MAALGLKGVGVSRGVAIGPVRVLQHNRLNIREYTLAPSQIDDELMRFQQALRVASQQLAELRAQIPVTTSVDIASFIDSHLLMLEDSALSQVPQQLIRERRCNAEWALKLQRDALVAVFDAMDDAYLRTRKDDVEHVVTRIQRALMNERDQAGAADDLHGCIIVADDLSPADTVMMQHQGVAAFVTELGGPTSHTTILARSLGIPAVVGVQHALRYVRHDDVLVVDGSFGEVLAGLEPSALELFRKRQTADRRHQADLAKLKQLPSISRDGLPVALLANAELTEDLSAAKRVGAKGVGLFRTEFLFLNRSSLPDEQEQYLAYRKVVRSLKGAPLTIRTLDLGADKNLPSDLRIESGAEAGLNPALGARAIRLCLRDGDMFKAQLRAILRASADGPVSLMLPMIATEHEVLQALELLDQARQELIAEGRAFDESMPIGCMIEVPAAALIADALARHLDFFSIGTNDLIQYTMAADRLDHAVNYLYQPLHPGVLRLIDITLKAGRKAGIPVSMCGEMAGEPRFTRLLLGLGLREFSMQPMMLPEVKRIVQSTDVAAVERRARRALRAASAGEVERMLERINAL